jgi:hypothetical protein
LSRCTQAPGARPAEHWDHEQVESGLAGALRDGGTVTLPRDAGPVAAGRARGALARWWLVVVPCVLTLPVAGWGLLAGFVAGLNSCFDTCVTYSWWFNTPTGVTTLFFAELILGVAAVVILIVGLLASRWRRVLVLTGWGTCLLACAGAGLLHWYPR